MLSDIFDGGDIGVIEIALNPKTLEFSKVLYKIFNFMCREGRGVDYRM